jgi:hypothetical protein
MNVLNDELEGEEEENNLDLPVGISQTLLDRYTGAGATMQQQNQQ